MRHLILLSCLMASVGLTRAAGSSDLRFYAEPSVVYATGGGNIKDAVGASVALGVTLRDQHTLLVEVTRFKSGSDFEGLDFTFTPILAKYRFSLPMANAWTAYVGVAGGAVVEKASVSWDPYSFSVTDTAAAFGAEVGIFRKLNQRASVGLGLTTLEMSKTDVTNRGSLILVSLHLGYRF